ncbi:MAG: HlyD family efflux transporter periplasmic adaptor subunit [Bacteroidetes bacterium]|jgi:multidrug efflux pump subunit AcrA (membrane-fusion protein)|nr:HlyD family efflux transporter periplasmic adaptor subunit [Bacteroidota bacterium]
MKKTIIIAASAAVLLIIVLIVIGSISARKDMANLYVEAQRGTFDIIVTTTGELQAENSIDITGPEFMMNRRIRIMDIKITDLVPEGTEVKKGDYIGSLDKTTFDNSLKDELENLETIENNLEVRILDTAVTLSNLRDNIKNLKFSVEEARITVQESKFEPPTTQRQAEISLEKAIRSLEQAERSYELRVEQAKSDMRTIKNQLAEQRQQVNDLQTLLQQFDIYAPADGMVIYYRDRTNAKRKIGSSVSPWDNVVATLPDMSSMISKTYVNEIDVSKVAAGQKVEVMVDAFPDKKYDGTVLSVANIGEQLPNADAKVFEVIVKLNESDEILRPSMTTGNKIITNTISDVTFIPLECVHNTPDTIPFVYMKNRTRQIVMLGESNENNVVIEKGLEPGDKMYLNTPEEPEKFTKLSGEDFIVEIREKERIKKEAEKRANEAVERNFRGAAGGMTGMPRGMGGGGGMRGDFPGGAPGETMDSAAIRRFMEMRANMPQGQMPIPDTSAIRTQNPGAQPRRPQ